MVRVSGYGLATFCLPSEAGTFSGRLQRKAVRTFLLSRIAAVTAPSIASFVPISRVVFVFPAMLSSVSNGVT